MTETASQAKGPDQVDLGDSFTFNVLFDLPGIAFDQKADLHVELFSLKADYGELKSYF